MEQGAGSLRSLVGCCWLQCEHINSCLIEWGVNETAAISELPAWRCNSTQPTANYALLYFVQRHKLPWICEHNMKRIRKGDTRFGHIGPSTRQRLHNNADFIPLCRKFTNIFTCNHYQRPTQHVLCDGNHFLLRMNASWAHWGTETRHWEYLVSEGLTSSFKSSVMISCSLNQHILI